MNSIEEITEHQREVNQRIIGFTHQMPSAESPFHRDRLFLIHENQPFRDPNKYCHAVTYAELDRLLLQGHLAVLDRESMNEFWRARNDDLELAKPIAIREDMNWGFIVHSTFESNEDFEAECQFAEVGYLVPDPATDSYLANAEGTRLLFGTAGQRIDATHTAVVVVTLEEIEHGPAVSADSLAAWRIENLKKRLSEGRPNMEPPGEFVS